MSFIHRIPRPLIVVPAMILAGTACVPPHAWPVPVSPVRLVTETRGRPPEEVPVAPYEVAIRQGLAGQVRIAAAEDTGEASPLLRITVEAEDREALTRRLVADSEKAGQQEGWKDSGKSGNGLGHAAADAGAGIVGALIYGAVAGSYRSMVTQSRLDRHASRLGYQPFHLTIHVGARKRPDGDLVSLFSTEPFEVMKAMEPLPPGTTATPERIRQAEAEAVARVLARRMEKECGWKHL